MLFGMAADRRRGLIAAYGLLPRTSRAQRAAAATITVAAPEDAALGPAHWRLMAVLVIALTIDVMKPATLGFTVPGMVGEYGVPQRDRGAGALLRPGRHRHRLGGVGRDRRSLWPQGVDPAVGGDVRRHLDLRRDALARLEHRHVLPDGAGGRRHAARHLRAAGRDHAERAIAAGRWCWSAAWARSAAISRRAALSALLQPIFGWRILWLLNLPTGLLLVRLARSFPNRRQVPASRAAAVARRSE